MVVCTHRPAPCSYRVEISGWDMNEAFFVEKCEIAWSEEDGKHVVLDHKLRDGSIVFLRLLASTSIECTYPVAYEAEFVAADLNGHYRFRLSQVHPRHEERALAVN
jgi:hypothetical protein